MAEQTLSALLPILALIVTLLLVAGLWYWWSQGQEERVLFPSHPEERPAAGGEGIHEVLRVLRDSADGALIVEFEGRRYRALAEIRDAAVGRRFLAEVAALARFAHLADLKAPLAPAPSATESAPLQRSPEQPPPPPPLQRPAEKLPSALPTIADQIEELLQKRLQGEPTLAGRSIHMLAAPDGSAMVEVDGHFYAGVDEVPDAAIRTFIRHTIQEWEAQQGGPNW